MVKTLDDRKKDLIRRVDDNVKLLIFKELKRDWWALWFKRNLNGKWSHGCVYEERKGN